VFRGDRFNDTPETDLVIGDYERMSDQIKKTPEFFPAFFI
jgi:hypothetical protein